MKLVENKINIQELKNIAENQFGDMVKAVVDAKKGIIVIGGELHADEEAMLLEKGSEQKNLWGINLYLEIDGEDWIEFDSMINLRPSQNNRSRGVEDIEIQKQIINIVNNLVQR